jgi:hypothetical protein
LPEPLKKILSSMSGLGVGFRIGGRNPNFKTETTMKTITLKSLRTTILAALLSTSAVLSANAAAPDITALAGSIAVKAAGPYVQVGSYRIWASRASSSRTAPGSTTTSRPTPTAPPERC